MPEADDGLVELHLRARKEFLPYLQREARWSAVVAHRRAGKTVACIMDLIAKAAAHTGREPRFAYLAPTYTQAKDVAWTYLKQFTSGIPEIEKSESELWVTLPHNSARIRLYGAENYDRLRGLYLDGIVIDEAGDIDPRAWPEVIRPALSDRQGWATFIGTPKGRNDFFNIAQRAKSEPDWYFSELRASRTGLIRAEELEDAKRTLTPEQYAQEYECSFNAAILGTYYAKEMVIAEEEGRIGRVPHDRSADVYCSWDLGIGDSTALWFFQIIQHEWHFFHYYESSGQNLTHYIDYVKQQSFPVHMHIVPHDAGARGRQTGYTDQELMEQRGFKTTLLERHDPDRRINNARVKFNRFWFDAEGCGHGLDVLRMYRADYDEKNKALKSTPKHDWASHGADAFGYGVMGAEEKRMTVSFAAPDTEWVV